MFLAPISIFYLTLLVDHVHCFILNNKLSQMNSQNIYSNFTTKKWKNNSNSSSLSDVGNRKKVKLKKSEYLSHSIRNTEGTLVNSKKDSKLLAAIQAMNSAELELGTTCIYQFREKNITISPFFNRIHSNLTRSKDAVWATLSLTFICIVLFIAVAHSRMWKDHWVSDTSGVPLPNFNQRVPFKDVLEHKMKLLKEFVKNKKKRSSTVEMESLLQSNDEHDY